MNVRWFGIAFAIGLVLLVGIWGVDRARGEGEQAGSNYCPNWTILPGTDIARMRHDCQKGDIIELGAGQDFAIAELCDFSKSIFTTNHGVILCAMSEARAHR
jgi:hypothetical protein